MLNRYEEYNLAQPFSECDPFTAERYEQFHQYLAKGSISLLDVGCGTGRGGRRLAELNPNYRLFALDIVKSRLDQLPKCYHHRFLGNSTKIPADDQSFDGVLAGEFIEHLYPADVDPTLCEFQRVLKVGGRLMMTMPHPGSLKLHFKKGTVYTVGHLSQHWPRQMKERLLMHGFSRIFVRGSGKSARYLGDHFPILSAYGSYMIVADKI